MCRLRLKFWLAFSLLTFSSICRSLLSLHLHPETSPLASGRTSVRNHVVGKLPAYGLQKALMLCLLTNSLLSSRACVALGSLTCQGSVTLHLITFEVSSTRDIQKFTTILSTSHLSRSRKWPHSLQSPLLDECNDLRCPPRFLQTDHLRTIRMKRVVCTEKT
ncbi:hypothetical protein KCU83_g180, partial [Aureobasidium melanogenum]